jgi:hypothetical protein
MIREERSVLLSLLTLIGFSFLIFLEFGTFIYPFPLNEVAFLIVSSQFMWWHFSDHRLHLITVVLSAIFGLLASTFFWSFFLDHDTWELLYHGIWLDVFKLSNLIGTLIWMSFSLRTLIKEDIKRSWTILFPCLLIFGSIPYDPVLETIALSGMAIVSIIWKPQAPLHLLWVLLAGLQLLNMAMMWFI